jgi:hypothetical protein
MADESPEHSEKEKPSSQGEMLSDKWLRQIKNHPLVASLIVVGSLAVSVLTFANTFYEQWEKATPWFHTAKAAEPFDIHVDIIMLLSFFLN